MNVELRPMPADRLQPWIEQTSRDYEQSRIASGESAETAAEKARASTETHFPGGTPAPGHLVLEVHVPDRADERVGYLWIGPLEEGTDAWWVFDIEIDEKHRGAGLGRAVMQLAERTAAEHGAATLGLNVFDYNTIARRLYESLGYETTAVQMRKPVSRGAEDAPSL